MAGGKPPKYTKQSLDTAVERYFRSISRTVAVRDDAGMLVRNDEGEEICILQYLVPPTVSGLCHYLGIDRSTWQNYASAKLHPEMRELTARAKTRFEAYLEEQLLTREKNVQGIIFNLQNNYDWRQKTEMELGDKTRRSVAEQSQNLNVCDKIAFIASMATMAEEQRSAEEGEADEA